MPDPGGTPPPLTFSLQATDRLGPLCGKRVAYGDDPECLFLGDLPRGAGPPPGKLEAWAVSGAPCTRSLLPTLPSDLGARGHLPPRSLSSPSHPNQRPHWVCIPSP